MFKVFQRVVRTFHYFNDLSVYRYKENPNIAHESAHAQAREALKKYLHYFERVSTRLNSPLVTANKVNDLFLFLSGRITPRA